MLVTRATPGLPPSSPPGPTLCGSHLLRGGFPDTPRHALSAAPLHVPLGGGGLHSLITTCQQICTNAPLSTSPLPTFSPELIKGTDPRSVGSSWEATRRGGVSGTSRDTRGSHSLKCWSPRRHLSLETFPSAPGGVRCPGWGPHENQG